MTTISHVSALILAGGFSSRMGSDKAQLPWGDEDLLMHQVNKVRAMGIADVLVCGCQRELPQLRIVQDVYPHRGPLSGIHAGLLAALHDHCLVLGVDTPLIPAATLRALVDTHIRQQNSITILEHQGHWEPLIGLYEKRLASDAEAILKTPDTAVRRLFSLPGFATMRYTGDVRMLSDCNTREEYDQALTLDGRMAACAGE